ncbi:polycomb group protein EMBRYONIC FLOWER 2-like isoform X1 [Alnus glutinosa]|uniref:polycomb group protein EMBRYONIC FLOWER 2-like isoform X1 n=1 Tax=Alnus glutinosa TaxID=3517 RepID=UPI002D78928C|nr:polycomb group protein EMBRYONIC FLOWER 2-like isoform X1 [Alnus glutinosa]XP_062145816.1 polycomb group protein EMBRYONIC FLOWER 2-like isoform X1 [Alnus glutinosa]
MCLQNSCVHLSVEEATAAEESLLTYCKPVELYNILRCRALHNPSFLRRCLHYKIQSRRKRRLKAGIVIFNYKDCTNMLRKTEVYPSMYGCLEKSKETDIKVTVTEDFSCPFCLMECASFKGLRYHLCSSHDLFNFEFWVTEEYHAVNVSVKIDILGSETVAAGVEPKLQTFLFCSRPRKLRRKDLDENEKRVNILFLEMDSPRPAGEGIRKGFLEKDDDVQSSKGEKVSKSFPSEKEMLNGRVGGNYGPDYPGATGCIERVASSSNVPGVSIAMAQSSGDPECVKSLSGSDPTVPAKARKLSMERSDPRNRALLQKRQFFHSHRVQPMALDQVLSDRDSEDEVDDDIADLEDRRMLDDFVDVTKDEKKLMHLWNSFVRKQRVLADGHVPWACEAFSKLHRQELTSSPALFWCWRLFMIKLWNHGLLDACTMNNCSLILEKCRDEGSDAMKK